MKRLKQILVTTFVVTVLAVLLTGCREDTPENLKQDYEFAQVCADFGGDFYRNPPTGDISCHLG